LILQFHGSMITSDGALLVIRIAIF